MDTAHVGYLVTLGGVIGAAVMVLVGDIADRHGDRFLGAFWLLLAMGAALLAMALAQSQVGVTATYTVFAAGCFTCAMLVSSGWADVLHVRELAVGAAAINSVCRLGSFVMPFGCGAARDATGSFAAGLSGLAIMALAGAPLALLIRKAALRRAADGAEALAA